MKKLFLISLLILAVFNVNAQKDSVIISISEADSTQTAYDKMFKYFIQEKKEIKHLWKFDAIQWGQLRPAIAFEKKIGANFSIEPGFYVTDFSLGMFDRFCYNAYIDLKYYFNFKRRERKGKNINGFSGDYLSIGFSHVGQYYYPYYYFDNKPDNNTFLFSTSGNYGFQKMTLLMGTVKYGIQRRIGNIGYIESQFGFGIGTNTYTSEFIINPQLNLRLGFELSSLRRKKR